MRTLGAVTTSRAEYGILTPVLRAIQDHPDLRLQLIVGGMHLRREFGFTVREIERDGFAIDARVDMLVPGDSPEAVAKSMGEGVQGFADAYTRLRPDLLLVIGDRFEMHAAVVAAAPFRIPVAHIAGGEVTRGAIDELFRHSITKLSHLHFVSTEEYARRVLQMGEEPWRVHVTGLPSIDTLLRTPRLPREEISQRLALSLPSAPLLVTVHPETQSAMPAEEQSRTVLRALDSFTGPVVITAPNADSGGMAMAREIQSWAAERPNRRFVANLGTQVYVSLMAVSAAMVGNSSSGIIEAASFELPVVNVGDRQHGRIHPANVVTVPWDANRIRLAVEQALSAEFRERLTGLKNPFGDGHASERIAGVLASVELGPKLQIKKFYDQPADAGREWRAAGKQK